MFIRQKRNIIAVESGALSLKSCYGPPHRWMIKRLICILINWSIHWPIFGSVNQSINRSINQSIIQSIRPSTNQPIKQRVMYGTCTRISPGIYINVMKCVTSRQVASPRLSISSGTTFMESFQGIYSDSNSPQCSMGDLSLQLPYWWHIFKRHWYIAFFQ